MHVLEGSWPFTGRLIIERHATFVAAAAAWATNSNVKVAIVLPAATAYGGRGDVRGESDHRSKPIGNSTYPPHLTIPEDQRGLEGHQ